jgi:hypothetical protein
MTRSSKLPLILVLALASLLCATVALSTTTAPPKAPSAAAPQSAPKQRDWTGTAQKWVPIFSIDNVGVSIGAAQVAGPKAQVAKVKAVAQLGLTFKSLARIYAYVPVSSISAKLDRVQGVSVWAIGDIELASF